jgi:hypothetical protein
MQAFGRPAGAPVRARCALFQSEGTTTDVLEGVIMLSADGATPYEIAQCYAAGEISRDQLVAELIRFPYLPTPRTNGYDSLLVIPPGTVQDIVWAAEDGLLDDALYAELVKSIPPPAE